MPGWMTDRLHRSFPVWTRGDQDRLWTLRTVKAVAAFCFLFLVFVQILAANPFPYSDEWGLVPYALGSEPLSWEWLWAQHVDHRIPLQKLVQVLLLRAGSVDFRVLVIANAVLAYLVTRLLLSAVKGYRGYTSLGDALIPLLLLNPGFGPFLWGFQMQFMSSVLLTLCALALLLRSGRPPSDGDWVAASGCLALLAFCGMNGAVLAGMLALALLVHLQFTRPFMGPAAAWAVRGLLVAAMLVVGLILLSWHPSGASGVAADMSLLETARAVTSNWVRLMSPRGWRLPPAAPDVYFLFNGLLYAAAITLMARRLWSDRTMPGGPGAGPVFLLVLLTGMSALLFSIAIGRAAYWSPGLEIHYGYLALCLPLASWVILSTELSRKTAAAAALILLVVYGAMYIENARLSVDWYVKEQRRKVSVVLADIGSGMPLDDFVDKHILLFFYLDSENSRRWLKEGIRTLKRAGIEPYRRIED